MSTIQEIELNNLKLSLQELKAKFELFAGPGKGNWGHAGRPGVVGGSSGGGGGATAGGGGGAISGASLSSDFKEMGLQGHNVNPVWSRTRSGVKLTADNPGETPIHLKGPWKTEQLVISSNKSSFSGKHQEGLKVRETIHTKLKSAGMEKVSEGKASGNLKSIWANKDKTAYAEVDVFYNGGWQLDLYKK